MSERATELLRIIVGPPWADTATVADDHRVSCAIREAQKLLGCELPEPPKQPRKRHRKQRARMKPGRNKGLAHK